MDHYRKRSVVTKRLGYHRLSLVLTGRIYFIFSLSAYDTGVIEHITLGDDFEDEVEAQAVATILSQPEMNESSGSLVLSEVRRF